jgi:hypothetical protein
MPDPTSPKTINGPVHAVPCPWCGKSNDCRGLQKDLNQAFEKGTTWDCDHCGNTAQITTVKMVPVVAVRQYGPQRNQIQKR